MIILIYFNGYHVETVFSLAQLADALKYWQARGVVTTAPDPHLISLY